ncbi:hypothetical protein Syun_021987 [Stephania yunnanensis]|uniref:Uncharacterized protein n=1 Tax=Stephania yunnanensis TaxID=152371 RepID=A0AAP0IH33_9MAGN
MFDPVNALIPPSSPTISSVSSSDFDTESTGSFFHDRSTSLGTLMGVDFPPISIRVSSHRENRPAVNGAGGGGAGEVGRGGRKGKSSKARKRAVVAAAAAAADRRQRRRWWKLCRDDVAGPSSLGEFLEVERRYGGDGGGGEGEYYGAAAEYEGVAAVAGNGSNGRVLFADGRVLPPRSGADLDSEEAGPSASALAGALSRFPVLLTGICSGGGGS